MAFELFIDDIVAALAKQAAENAGDVADVKLASFTNGSLTGPSILDAKTEGGIVITPSTGVESVVTEAPVTEIESVPETPAEEIIVETQETALLGQGREIAKDLGMFENGQYQKLIDQEILRREGESLFVYDAEGHKIAEVINLEEKAPGLHKWYSAQGHDVKYIFSTIDENKPFSTVSALKEVGIDLDNSKHDVIYFADHASDDHLKGDLCKGDFKTNALIKVDYGTGCEAPAVPLQIVEDVPEAPVEETPAEVVPTEPAVETPAGQTIINNDNRIFNITIESSSTAEELVIPVEEPADLHLPPNPAEGIPCDVTVIAHDNSGRLTEMHVDFHEKSGRVLRITGAEDIARYIKDNPAALDPARMYIGEDGYVYDKNVRGVSDFEEGPRRITSSQTYSEGLFRAGEPERLVRMINAQTGEVSIYNSHGELLEGRDVRTVQQGHRFHPGNTGNAFGGDPRMGRGMPFEVRGGFYGGQSSFGQSPFGHDQIPPARTGGGYTIRGRRW